MVKSYLIGKLAGALFRHGVGALGVYLLANDVSPELVDDITGWALTGGALALSLAEKNAVLRRLIV